MAGRDDKVNLLRADVSKTLLSSISNSISDSSGKALHISSNFLAGKVVWKLTVLVVSTCVTISISRSVAVSERTPSLELSNTLPRIGRVWRRSTAPMICCNGPSRFSLLITIFIYIYYCCYYKHTCLLIMLYSPLKTKGYSFPCCFYIARMLSVNCGYSGMKTALDSPFFISTLCAHIVR